MKDAAAGRKVTPVSHSWRQWGAGVRLALSLVIILGGMAGPEQGKAAEPVVRLTRISADGARVSLEWSDPAPDMGYEIQVRDSLSEGQWLAAPATVMPLTAGGWNDPRAISGAARFYRVRSMPGVAERGKLLTVTELPALSVAQIRAVFLQAGVPLPPERGVRLHRLQYETVNPFNLRTTGSGLLITPEQNGGLMPLVSYQHGTLVSREDSPSLSPGSERVIGIALATSGYAATLPDYVGLGDSPGLHPFVHAKSEATATIDLLRAARAFCAAESMPLNGQLFLMGYSQGGHATMATHKEIEEAHSDEFVVTASAPMAGPYDLSGVMLNDFLSGRSMPNPYYFIYLLASYQSIYQFAGSLAEILASPYDTLLPPLLDGRHDGSELNRAIGSSLPSQLLKPEFLQAFQNDPGHPLRIALRANDLYDWTPRAPMNLYHCDGDQDVVFANSQTAYDRFVERGATQVRLWNPFPTAGHGNCAPIALLAAKLWFDELVASEQALIDESPAGDF